MYYKDSLNIKFFVLLLIFLFPGIAATVQHGGTGIYLILMFAGLVWGWKGFQYLSADEKKVIWGFLFFFFIIILSLINTTDYSMAGKKFERYLRIIGIIPIYLLLVRLNIQIYKPLVLGVLVSAVILLSVGLYEIFVLHKLYMEGVYYTILFGYVSVLNLFLLVLALLIENMTNSKKIFYFIACVILLFCVILAQSRAPWLAAIFIFIFLASVIMFTKKIKITLKSSAIVMVVMLLVIGLNVERIEKRINAGVHDAVNHNFNQVSDTSLGIRLDLWKDSINLFLDSPVLGTGVGDFDYDRDIMIKQGLATNTPSFGHAHNQFLDSLATTGVLGIIGLLVGVFIVPIWYFWKQFNTTDSNNIRYFSLSGMVVVIGFIFFGMGEVWLARNPTANVYAFLIAISLAGITNSRKHA